MILSRSERNFAFPGTSVEFPYSVITSQPETSAATEPVVHFHGYGEGYTSVEFLAREAESAGIPLILPRIDFAGLRDRGAFGTRRQAVDRLAREFFPHLLEELGDEQNSVLHATAYSMGAMMLAYGLDETNGEFTKNVAVINGMGTSTDPEKGRLHRSRATYLARFGLASASGTKPQEGYVANAAATAWTIARDATLSRTFGAQLAIANETSTVRSYVDHAARGNHVHIAAGQKDRLFNPLVAQALFHHYAQLPETPTLEFEIVPKLTHQDGGMDKARAAIVQAAQKITKF